jgi:CheY-like chemotaxis protein/anti-sigma regulatory factor (Ser/Thr protein kinase)
VRIRDFLDQLVDMFRLQAHAKGLEFHFIAPKHLPAVVHTDESRLRQILINLLSNAIKFTDAGHVTLRVTYRSQVAEFEVEDTGIGIHASDHERIFQPFERARSARARSTTGTGLGLTITQLLAESMGGDIGLRSEPGKGTALRVKLFLPEVANPRMIPMGDDHVRGYVGPRQTILIADDDPIQRDLLCELLLPLGFEVFVADGGPECLALAEQHKPNLVLLDVSMPEMDGWEIARRLRLPGRERSTAIVMLSALAPDKDQETEPERLHDGYLMKPVDLRQLLDTIHVLLDVEWTYDTEPARAPSLPMKDLLLMEAPAPHDLEELMRLSEIGYVRGIEAKLDELAAQSPRCGPLIAQLRALASSFDLRGFNATLAAIRRTHV